MLLEPFNFITENPSTSKGFLNKLQLSTDRQPKFIEAMVFGLSKTVYYPT